MERVCCVVVICCQVLPGSFHRGESLMVPSSLLVLLHTAYFSLHGPPIAILDVRHDLFFPWLTSTDARLFGV